MTPAFALALHGSFGSVERWREEFVRHGQGPGGGSGWVLLVFQPREGTLVNQWAADRAHAAAGVSRSWRSTCTNTPTTSTSAPRPARMSMRSCEHPLGSVYARTRRRSRRRASLWRAMADDLAGAPYPGRPQGRGRSSRRIPSSRAPSGATRDSCVPGARSCPGTSRWWSIACTGTRSGARRPMRLRAAGVDARFLRGGIDGWKSAGRPLAPKPT